MHEDDPLADDGSTSAFSFPLPPKWVIVFFSPFLSLIRMRNRIILEIRVQKSLLFSSPHGDCEGIAVRKYPVCRIQTTAISNVRYIGDVGEVDLYLLKDILPHCNIDQLTHIENSTEGRDLTPVTDALWKRFYEQQFGVESANTVIKRMKQKKVVFKWRQLFEAKSKEREEAQNKMGEKLKQRYAETQAKKQSRQIQICSKIPPSAGKRSYWGGSGPSSSLSNVKGNLMKKAKLEYLNSHEAKVHALIRRNASQGSSLSQPSLPRSTRHNNFLQSNSASSSKNGKPVARK
ncbi:hypothetical protein OPV22_031225 [Ensete ventricosum]|uniref:Elongin-A n=1 Tax=Ensete ventricosum TaxID=4639 RepID=A0AAV8PNK1_ENSVE|nr:hypothetical protein OPV22_031225 [Ensete ventricosum]